MNSSKGFNIWTLVIFVAVILALALCGARIGQGSPPAVPTPEVFNEYTVQEKALDTSAEVAREGLQAVTKVAVSGDVAQTATVAIFVARDIAVIAGAVVAVYFLTRRKGEEKVNYPPVPNPRSSRNTL